jgi:putative phosphoesterase
MRILVVADVHANRAALEAIREPFDTCLFLGDLVEYGPEPEACIDWVRDRCRQSVRGNHDHGAAQNVDVQGVVGFRYLTRATRKPTAARLTAAHRRFLADLPTSSMLTLGGLRFLLVHATPRDPLEEYAPPDPKLWAARLAHVRADFVCVGHTHHQFALKVGDATVLNPGSVGLPRDGDPRARYAIIDDGKVELKQVSYDVEATVAAVMASEFESEAKRQLAEVYRLGKYVYTDGNGNGTNGHANGHTNGNGVYTNGRRVDDPVQLTPVGEGGKAASGVAYPTTAVTPAGV